MSAHSLFGGLLLRVSAHMRAREIRLDGQRYLERHFVGRRIVVRIGPVTVYMHRYLGSDGDREVHDHPWSWSLGIPLVGGYDEERVIALCPRQGWVSRTVRVRPWRWNWIGSLTFHRIAHVEPGTWTLFLHGPRIASWGFLRRDPETGDVIYYKAEGADSHAGWTEHAPPAHELRAKLDA